MQTLYRKALDKWGEDTQLNIVIEECAELIKAVSKYKRNRDSKTILDKHGIAEEIVDMEIMLGQLKMMGLGLQKGDLINTIAKYRKEKHQDLLERITMG